MAVIDIAGLRISDAGSGEQLGIGTFIRLTGAQSAREGTLGR